jgi:23S rRNA-/tRNA-specific pseudouridylate synthase
MVFARTAEAHRALNRQFELHRAEKAYLAIAAGSPPWNEKIARHPLRVNAGHKHRTAVDSRSGKPSETRFRIIQRYQAHVLLEAQPVTGRTHQVRAHATALGYPLLGDVLYGAPETDLIARPALHARSLTLQIPEDQNWRLDAHRSRPSTFTAPLPDDFEIALTRISNID